MNRIIRTPRIPLGEVLCLVLDRAESRKSVALIFTLFRGSFEVNIDIFLAAAGLSDARDPIMPITFRPVTLEVSKAWRPTGTNSKGTTIVLAFVPGKTQSIEFWAGVSDYTN